MKITKVEPQIEMRDPQYMVGKLYRVNWEGIDFYDNTKYYFQNFDTIGEAKEYRDFLAESVGLNLDYSDLQTKQKGGENK